MKSRSYPYWLYINIFQRAKEFDLADDSNFIGRKEWNSMMPETQEYCMTQLEEEMLHKRMEEEECEE